MALALVLVAGLAILREEPCASGGVARQPKSGLIARHHRGSVRRGLAGEDRQAALPRRRIRKVSKDLATGRVKLGNGDLLVLESLDQRGGRRG